MWNEIKKSCPNSTPSYLIVDFEKAAINSFSLHYPATQIKGCFFHIAQTFGEKFKKFAYPVVINRTQHLH